MLQGAGRPEDHYIIPPVFIGFADAFVYLRDNKKFEDEVHKILARTVSQQLQGGLVAPVTCLKSLQALTGCIH